jgi:hypothetical protein
LDQTVASLVQDWDRCGLNLGWLADVESKKSLKGAWSHAKFGERIHEDLSLGGAARALRRQYSWQRF